MKKKLFGIIMCLMLIVGMFPAVAMASGETETPITNIAVTITAPALGETPDYNPTFTTTPNGDTMYNVFVEWYKLAEADYTNGIDDDWTDQMDHDETFTTGYYYAPAFHFMPKPGYELATTITATVNGQPHISGYGDVYQMPPYGSVYAYVTYDFEPLTAAPPAVAIVEGNGSEWAKGTTTGLRFRSTADYTNFDHVEVDGVRLDATNYTVQAGSTIVTLNPAYLETLAVGRHTIVIQSANDRPEALFNVKETGTTGGNTTPTDGNNKPTVNNTDRVAKTGDEANMAPWIALMAVAAVAGTGTVIYRRKNTVK